MKHLKIISIVSIITITLFGCSKNDDNDTNDEQQTDPNAIVAITDANFKDALINYDNPTIDTNGDGEIQVSEAEAIFELWIINKGIRNLQGIEAFKNLDALYANDNGNLEIMDLSQNTELEILNVNFTELASINISENFKLSKFNCFDCLFLTTITFPNNGGVLEEINVSGTLMANLNTAELSKLKYMYCGRTKVTELDFSQNPLFEQLFGEENPLLNKINLKNGNINQILDVQVLNCPLLTSICVDDVEVANAKDPERWKKDVTANYTTNCN